MISRFNISVSFFALLLCAVVGCGDGPEAEYVISERTKNLIPEARKQVKTTLEDNFGTSNNIVAWTRLPIEYGGHRGTVVADEEAQSGETKNFKVEFATPLGAQYASEAAENKSQTEIVFLSGDFAGLTTNLDSFSGETQTITTRKAFDNPPKEGDEFVLNPGQQMKFGRQLYMTHCVHCHGTSGDGNGPTARYLNPRPRDYRKGLFKFTSTLQPEKPQKEDLHRIIRQGIPGTYMPSFLLLKDDELAAITEYIVWLSMRGEVEDKINSELRPYLKSEVAAVTSGDGAVSRDQVIEDFNNFVKNDYPEVVSLAGEEVGEYWTQAQTEEALVIPTGKRVEADAASIARGRQLFVGKAKCADCHGITGRGDGPQTVQILKDVITQEDNPGPGLYDTWGNKIKPRNLTTGTYRGGRRPIDIYCRIHAGIKGTPMPPNGLALKNDEIWDVVNYVMSIPFEGKEAPPSADTSDRTVAKKNKHDE